jgi:hypothetical protein
VVRRVDRRGADEVRVLVCEADLAAQTLRTTLAIIDAEPAARGGPLVLRGPGA